MEAFVIMYTFCQPYFSYLTDGFLEILNNKLPDLFSLCCEAFCDKSYTYYQNQSFLNCFPAVPSAFPSRDIPAPSASDTEPQLPCRTAAPAHPLSAPPGATPHRARQSPPEAPFWVCRTGRPGPWLRLSPPADSAGLCPAPHGLLITAHSGRSTR